MRKLVVAAAVFLVAGVVVLWWVRRPVARLEEKPLNVGEVLGGSAPQGFKRAVEPRHFSFPADHGSHPSFRNEWWYFTGNLATSDGRRFGYQLTFFRAALAPEPVPRGSRWGTNEIFMAHFALSDVEGKRFRSDERFSRAALSLAGAGGRPLEVRLEDWSVLETASRPWSVKLSAADAEMAIELNLKSLKPEVLNGERGLSRKSGTIGNASYYYSIPRMETTGTIRSGKESFKVTGLSWLDREWSTSALEKNQVGWDWFALHLDDGRDIMFYQLRRRDGSADPFSSGTLVAPDGSYQHLTREEVTLQPQGWWTSPETGTRYPAGWRLAIPGQRIDLQIVPRLADQELRTGFRYWEGAVELRGQAGSPSGSGYLEMTGY
jgi:predicted secreted hydrolase